ncbi:MAG: hypothetical protein CMC31_05330 [Flavobacteriaceae bacterium]|nr:hypothetical protein [Flavobacteriaceae bacterium]RCL66145.1 MAG: YceI family protein [Cryomorphaceae bacterium]|tara:strand:+ start:248 stop:790 length:543 start_codon:yes stop_codon:yes gene_type:complete
MKNTILIFLFLISPLINCFSQDTVQWMLNSEKSLIEYKAKHILHQWTGTNKSVKGVFFLNNNESKIAIAANIADFDTGISNRDSNTIRVLDALNYPQVKFYSDQIVISEKSISFDGELDFHGIKINKKVESSFVKDGESIIIEGVFSVVLTDFEIKLPSLMLKKMEDFADISYKLVFNNL